MKWQTKNWLAKPSEILVLHAWALFSVMRWSSSLGWIMGHHLQGEFHLFFMHLRCACKSDDSFVLLSTLALPYNLIFSQYGLAPELHVRCHWPGSRPWQARGKGTELNNFLLSVSTLSVIPVVTLMVFVCYPKQRLFSWRKKIRQSAKAIP